MKLTPKTFAQFLIGIVGYCVWAAMAYADPTQRHDFLAFNIAMASGTILVVVRDMTATEKPESAPHPPDTPPTETPVTTNQEKQP
jgi:hypothetical protein